MAGEEESCTKCGGLEQVALAGGAELACVHCGHTTPNNRPVLQGEAADSMRLVVAQWRAEARRARDAGDRMGWALAEQAAVNMESFLPEGRPKPCTSEQLSLIGQEAT